MPNLFLPQNIESKIESALNDLGTSLADSKKMAESILKMSDYYIENPEAPTPWKEKWAQVAQIAYYLPLNLLRNQAVFAEMKSRYPDFGITNLLDYGSGLGAGLETYSASGHRWAVEKSSIAIELYKKIWGTSTEFLSDRDLHQLESFTALFSYSLTELENLPSWALKAEKIIVIEPGTQKDGRKLLETRRDLIHRGFQILAPCTHQGECPLLKNSNTDWCHERIHWEQPPWFAQIERHLPIKNQELSFSFLVASKKSYAKENEQWRVIGNPLFERGKTRQMICRNSDREFLAWLHRHGEPQTFLKGEVIEPLAFEKKSNELRVIAKN
jgi:ribosomal protein RSM22 (predicted rRNA methylase)